MQINESSVKDLLKEGKGANEILLSFGIAPESLEPSVSTLFSTLITMLSSLMDSIDSNFNDMNSRIDELARLIKEKDNWGYK